MRKKFITIVTVLVMAFTVFAITPDTSSAATAKYWLKVNTQSNVVNVYKKTDGKWVPIRAMLCRGHVRLPETFRSRKSGVGTD